QALHANRPAPPARAGKAPLARSPRVSRSISHAAEMFFERIPHEAKAFTTALPAFDAFPLSLWSRQVAKHWRGRRDIIMGYGDPSGYMPLRRAIAAHLRTSRGIACEPEQVFVVSGAQQGFHLIGTVLLDPGDTVWFENPGAIGARNSLVAQGARLAPVPVDTEGIVVAEGLRRAPDFRLIFVTPSHQQPTGVTMSLERRFGLLHAAAQADAWIVEDDYDGEFTYTGPPLPTLKSLDAGGRVIYVGTFSKTLFPALRLGFLLAPPALVDMFERVCRMVLQGVSSNLQAVVADFMDEGHFATHIRRMRKIYAERQQVFYEASSERLPGLLEVEPTGTGFHTIGHLPHRLPELAVTRAARERGLAVNPIRRYCIEPVDMNGLVLGFSSIPPPEIRAGVDVLADVLERLDVPAKRA
ncbi:MAG: PLP-dependent aminotransferase family protein, partial [Arenicellales bacterium]